MTTCQPDQGSKAPPLFTLLSVDLPAVDCVDIDMFNDINPHNSVHSYSMTCCMNLHDKDATVSRQQALF